MLSNVVFYRLRNYDNCIGGIIMKSIQAKIMWLLFWCVLVSSLIIGSLGIVLTTTTIRESSTENMKLLCKTKADKIDIVLAKVEDSVDTLVHFISASVEDPELLKDEAYRAALSANVESNVLHHIESTDGAAAVYLYYDPVLIGKTDGFFYAKYDSSDAFVYHPLTDIAAYPSTDSEQIGWWYVPTVRGTATWFEAHYDATLDRYVVSYVVPIYKNDHLIGVIGADIFSSYIEDLVKEVSVFRSGQAAILKSDGTVLYHPNFDRGVLIGAGDPGFDGVIEKLTREDATNELISYQLKDVEKQLASCKLKNGMLMICFAPVSEIYQRQNELILGSAVITALVVIIALTLAFLVSRRLVRPLKNLNEAAKQLTVGEFDYRIRANTRDEIGELTKTFIKTRKILKHQIHLLETEAHRDGLTGVGNKSAFTDREKEINEEIAIGNADFTIVVFDVNKLKVTNDVFGHIVGDKLLSTVTNHLAATFDSTNVYRLGGDEFVVIIPEVPGVDSSEKITACISGMNGLSIEGYPNSSVSCAFGAARFNPLADHQLSDVLRRADKEMYRNKALSKRQTFPWQEGAKDLKQLQIDKYCRLLQSLKESTDDYLLLIDLETGHIRFFGGSDRQFVVSDGESLSAGISKTLDFVHPNDRTAVKQVLSDVLNRDTETLNINFRMFTDSVENMYWTNCRGSVIREGTDDSSVLIGRMSLNSMKHLYNPVTTLFNKTKLAQDLRQHKAPDFRCLMLVDIDNLSEINLKHGSVYGDQLLKSLAEKLETTFSPQQLYHAEMDRFVLLLDQDSEDTVRYIYEEIQAFMAGKCTVSAAVVPNDSSLFINEENIYDYAIQTLSSAKEDGSGKLAFFSRESILEKISTVALWEELERSVKSGYEGFYLVYQPQISNEDFSIVSVEVLLRFRSKDRGTVFPNQFIPILEQTGLINEVGLWVVDEALAKCKYWRSLLPHFAVSVNISTKQFERKQLAQQVKSLLHKHGLPSDALILEITESAKLDDNKEVYEILGQFQQAGIRLAIDDFGTGYSNLVNLKHIQADILKIDRVFIRDIKANGYNYHLLHNVFDFAKTNRLKICVESVETRDELFVISGLDPDTFQGYLFDKPISAEELEEKYFQTNSVTYASRLRQVEQLLQERKYAPMVNLDTKAILQGVNIGLWSIRVNIKTGVGELYCDSMMKKLLGVRDGTTPKECYDHWWNNIHPEYISAVAAMVEEMKTSDKVIQVEYGWHHPSKGNISVRCSGRCAEIDNDIVSFEGFHRVLSDMGKSF